MRAGAILTQWLDKYRATIGIMWRIRILPSGSERAYHQQDES